MLTLAHPGTPRHSLTSENHTDPSPVYLSRCTQKCRPSVDLLQRQHMCSDICLDVHLASILSAWRDQDHS